MHSDPGVGVPYAIRICSCPCIHAAIAGKSLLLTRSRWFLADTFGHLAYGEPPGCISQGRDAGGLIHALQSIYSMAGTVAVLPWLMMPLMRNKLFQNLVMPHLTAVKGLQKLKDVS